MKKLLSLTLGLLALAALAVPSGPANAATIAGPYYATPSWDQTFPAANRFGVLSNMGGAAVLDRETGLVWEQAPDGTNTYAWEDAQIHCNTLSLGGRLGWRLPTLQDLASLIDPTVPFPGPTLPAGHPFTNVRSANYWSATTDAGSASLGWDVSLGGGNVGTRFDKAHSLFAWCLRGGQGVNPQ
jgi:hypothetical protein